MQFVLRDLRQMRATLIQRGKKMADKSKNKVEKNDYRSRQMRFYRIFIAVVAVIVILSMALSLVKF
jgi:hypothetical protein